jgi:hypothetical protein
MKQDDIRAICRLSLDLHGIPAQVSMLAEECSELSVACHHYNRRRPDALIQMVEEIADVTIMIEQATMYLPGGWAAINEAIDTKLRRVSIDLDRERWKTETKND